MTINLHTGQGIEFENLSKRTQRPGNEIDYGLDHIT